MGQDVPEPDSLRIRDPIITGSGLPRRFFYVPRGRLVHSVIASGLHSEPMRESYSSGNEPFVVDQQSIVAPVVLVLRQVGAIDSGEPHTSRGCG